MAKDKIILAEVDIDLEALKKSMKDTQKEIEELEKKQEKLIKKGKESGDKFKENAQDLKQLQAAFSAQQAVLQAQEQAVAKNSKTFSDYKQQVIDSAKSINIFNGDIAGFISKAQQAGGLGPMLKGAFGGITEGIRGMGASLKANPVGAILMAIQIVVQGLHKVFQNFTPVVNMVEQGVAAVGAVFESLKNSVLGLLTGATSLGDFFSGFTGSAANAAKEAANLKKEQQELAEQMQAQDVANEQSAQKIDDFIAKSKNMALSEKERAKAMKDATDEQEKNYNDHKKLADDAYNQAVKQIQVGKNLTDNEITNLKEKGITYAQELAKRKSISQEELDALRNAQKQKIQIEREGTAMQQSIRDAAAAADAQREEDAQKKREDIARRRQEWEDKKQQALDSAAERVGLELEQFIQAEGDKAKTLKESVEYIEEVTKRKIAAARAEYNASEKNGNDVLKRDMAINEAKHERLKMSADATAKFAQAELNLWLQQNQSLIKSSQQLTDTLIAQEEERLNKEKEKRVQVLEAEYGLNAAKVAAKQQNNEQLTAEEANFYAKKLEMDRQYSEQVQKNRDTFDAQIKARDAERLEADNQIKLDNAQTQYDEDIINEQIRYDDELLRLKEQLDKKNITDEQYAELKKARDNEHAENEKKINDAKEKAIRDQYMNTFGQVSQLLGKKTVAGKAAAIAEATMNTYNGVTQVWATQSILPEPIATIMKGISTAVVVASGLSAVSKIKSTGTPKAEKGALFSIGGNRHSAGGTMFRGADGTAFEAEQGELIGVMNRNAARHFMAFNNAFPAGAGSAPNYFAGGGIVSREIATPGINPDELAAKIAEANRSLPAPVVAVQDIITQGNSYVQVRDGANF